MSAHPFLPPSRQTGRRADARVRLGLGIPCSLVLLGETVEGRLEDISRTGARIALVNHVAMGSEGVLTVQGVETFGEVVWFRAGRIGFQFDEKLALDSVVRLRHFADSFHDYERRRRERMAQEFVQGRRI